MITRTQDQICSAITGRNLIHFQYDMQARSAEPHCLGSDKDGELTLCGWQTSGPEPGWRNFHLSKMGGLTLSEDRFDGPRPGYNPNPSIMARIICCL